MASIRDIKVKFKVDGAVLARATARIEALPLSPFVVTGKAAERVGPPQFHARTLGVPVPPPAPNCRCVVPDKFERGQVAFDATPGPLIVDDDADPLFLSNITWTEEPDLSLEAIERACQSIEDQIDDLLTPPLAPVPANLLDPPEKEWTYHLFGAPMVVRTNPSVPEGHIYLIAETV